MVEPLLELRNICKSFPGVRALDEVSLDVQRGEVHALVGENGAGKSTLIRIITGAHRPDRGDLLWEGRARRLNSPQAAQRLGIAAIYQEPQLCQDLSALENLFLGRLPRCWGVLVDVARMEQAAHRVFAQLQADVDLRSPVSELSPAQRQMVEIARALLQQAKLVIMDEPTSSLADHDVEHLFAIVRELRRQGVAVIYISHRLDEVFALADRVTVLRDGQRVRTSGRDEVDAEQLITDMVGRPLERFYPRTPTEPGPPLLEVESLTSQDRFQQVSFVLRAGEIVGMAGLVGAGRTDVARAIFGLPPADGGAVRVAGRTVQIRNPADAIDNGIAYVPEDRQRQGLALPLTLRENMTLAVLRRLSRAGFVNGRAQKALTAKQMRALGVRAASDAVPARTLSGGNQQKVVLGKWLSSEPRVLLLDEPTRGVDVGAKAEIYQLIDKLAQSGMAILLISSELPEILGMSDRVLVMRQGRLVAEFVRAEVTQERILRAALAENSADVDAEGGPA